MNLHSAKEVGALVRSRRKQHGFTQSELATLVEVSPLWISQLERGKSTVQLGLVLRTMKELGLSFSVVEEGGSPADGGGSQINLDDIVGRGR